MSTARPLAPLALVALTLPIAAQEGGQPVGSLRWGGLDRMFVDPRDTGLAAVIERAPRRIADFLSILPTSGAAGAMDWTGLVDDVFAYPVALDVVTAEPPAQVPVRGQLAVDFGNADAASAFAESVASLVAGPGGAPRDESGFHVIPSPAGELFVGVEGGSAVLSFGPPTAGPAAPLANELPEGVEPALSFAWGGDALASLLPPDLPPGMASGPMGLLGLAELRVSMALGYDAHAAHIAGRYAGWAPMMDMAGALANAPLTAADFAPVPADATFVQVDKLDPGMLAVWLDSLASGADDPLGELEQQTGVHLQYDLLDHLGTTVGYYTSDTTGGSGLLSSVAFVAVEDPGALIPSLEAIARAMNGLAAQFDVDVELRESAHAGAQVHTITFPGLPIPVEPSWAVADGWLLAALTPRALAGALMHLAGGGASFDHAAALTALGLESDNAPTSVMWQDDARLLQDGYGWSSLGASAIANLMRTPGDTEWDPGLIVPPYGELVAGVGPSAVVAYVEGDDLVMRGRMDRSWVVNGVAALGRPSAAIGMAIGASLGWTMALPLAMSMGTMRAAEDESSRAMTQMHLVTLKQALDLYAIENGGRYPDSLDALVLPDEHGRSYLDSNEVPRDLWGNEFQYELQDGKPVVWSYGADGLPGGDGADADVFDWR